MNGGQSNASSSYLHRGDPSIRRAVILTSSRDEFLAVRVHLTDIVESERLANTICERGTFRSRSNIWFVCIAEIGRENDGPRQEAEKVIQFFEPEIGLFVGVAGGIKNVALGDVVAGTKVYGYEMGKVEGSFKPKLEVFRSTYELEKRARAESKKPDWLTRIAQGSTVVERRKPRAIVAPIAAGEEVVPANAPETALFLRDNYSDAVAVEMQGRGFLPAGASNRSVGMIVIRGISDLLLDKRKTEAEASQSRAAAHASAFAFELLAKLEGPAHDSPDRPPHSGRVRRDPTQQPKADSELPLNLNSGLSTERLLRFAADNPRIPFIGRERELEALHRFLDDPRPFLWWVVSGPGGSGKTRLALELCRGADGWRAGFLHHFREKENWSLPPTWRPSKPTLIVVDYASEQVDRIGTFASQLTEQVGDLDPPVRLLLVERDLDDLLEKRFAESAASEAGAMFALRYGGDSLALSQLGDDEIWALVHDCPWLPNGPQVMVSRDVFFARLAEIDSKHRPLVAMILAEASATSPKRTTFGTLEQELEALIEHDRRYLWPASFGAASTGIGGCDADLIIAFATMVNGLEPSMLADNAFHFSRHLNLDFLSDCARVTGQEWNHREARIGPLGPDLIGDFFALTVVGRGADGSPDNSWLAEAAWRADENAMSTFVARAAQSFPQHQSLNRVDIIVKGVTESWWNAIEGSTPPHWVGPEKVQAALDAAGTDEGAAGVLGRLVVLGQATEFFRNEEAVGCAILLSQWLRLYPGNQDLERGIGTSLWLALHHAKSIGDLSLRNSALDALRRFANQYPDSVIARSWLASSLADVLKQAKEEGDLVRRNFLLDELRQMTARYPTEIGTCGKLARSLATVLVDVNAEGDLQRRVAVMEELRQLAERFPRNNIVRRELATSLFNSLIIAHHEKMPRRRDALLDELRKLVTRYPNDAAVRYRFAMALANASAYHGQERELIQGEALLGELRVLNEQYPDDGDVRLRLAQGLQNSMIQANEDADTAKLEVLLVELRTLQQRNADDTSIRALLAMTLNNASAYAKNRKDLDRRDKSLNELRQLAGDHPDDKSVRQWLAASLFNTLNQVNEEALPVQRDALIEELRQLARSHPEDYAVRERLADGFLHSMIQAHAAHDLAGQEALFNELRQLAVTYPEDKQVRRLLAMGMSHRFDFDTEHAPAPDKFSLEELRQLAHQNPGDEEVRRHFAKSLAKAFVNANVSKDTGTRTSLVKELQTLANQYEDDLVVQQVLGAVLAQEPTGVGIREQIRAPLTELRELAVRYPADQTIREVLAVGLSDASVSANDVALVGERDALLNEMGALVEGHPSDAAVRMPLAMALARILVHARKHGDSTQSDQFLDMLRQLSARYSTDLRIQQILAAALSQLLPLWDDQRGRNALLSELRQLSKQFFNDEQIRQSLAAGLFGALVGAITYEGLDLEHGRALLNQLSELSEKYLDEPRLREVFAIALADLSLLAHVDGVPAQRNELFGRLRQLTERYPDDGTVRGWFTHASESIAANPGTDVSESGLVDDSAAGR